MPKAAAGAKKGRAPKAHKLPERFPPGETLYQAQYKKKWQLGDVIGQGGFGLIYKAFDVTDGPPNEAQPFVIKIEPIGNGPLFCELHFYQRVAKPENVEEWRKLKKLRYMAVPQFLGSGSHKKNDKEYRFLVLQHLSTDLQRVFEQNDRKFSEKTTFSIGLRMLDALEYIHDKGYCHADIKAANILLGYNGGKTDFSQVYLVDYGLAYRFLVDGAQRPYKADPKRAHDGTTEYASRDAHKGVLPSRGGDLEILAYCMLEWLAGSLPWSKVLSDKDKVHDLKCRYMNNQSDLFKDCFGTKPCPEGLKKYFAIVSKLAYDEKPDYNQLRQFLRSGIGNEWALGLTDGASPTKGVKRKTDAAGAASPKKKSRPSSSPAAPRRTASKASVRAAASTSGPALINGSSTPKPSTPRKKAKTAVRKSPKMSGGGAVIIPGIGKTKGPPPDIIPSTTRVKSPGAGVKSPGRGRPRKATPKKSSATSPAATRPSSATKGKGRTPQKRKRNKKTTSSDTAVQTSPGFGLRQNAV
ncbi:serine/threonine-protein kinase VRK1-like [Babylonia areolata]|uniref:serine/threonine-protein kinase VRK1-like n=1 Tax=Babylonia areolata TaxID=304850 RepID=UPI003FD128EA